MADYISRDYALHNIECVPWDTETDRNRAIHYVRELTPAADVVEVVRCKDCINWNGNDCITMHGLYAPRPNDYCSRGEREPDKEDWRTTLDRFKARMKIFFDEARSKEAG